MGGWPGRVCVHMWATTPLVPPPPLVIFHCGEHFVHQRKPQEDWPSALCNKTTRKQKPQYCL